MSRLTIGLLVLLATRAAGAQSTGTLIPIPYRSYISINPLLIPFDIGSVEFETATANGVTMGAVASYTDVDDQRYTSADLKVRYYPGEVVLRGFSVGASLGYLKYSQVTTTFVTPDGPPPTTARQTLNAPTLGVLVDYNWLLGTRRRFLVGTGIGAKRVLASSEERARVDIDRAYLTGRFTIGLAF